MLSLSGLSTRAQKSSICKITIKGHDHMENPGITIINDDQNC